MQKILKIKSNILTSTVIYFDNSSSILIIHYSTLQQSVNVLQYIYIFKLKSLCIAVLLEHFHLNVFYSGEEGVTSGKLPGLFINKQEQIMISYLPITSIQIFGKQKKMSDLKKSLKKIYIVGLNEILGVTVLVVQCFFFRRGRGEKPQLKQSKKKSRRY